MLKPIHKRPRDAQKTIEELKMSIDSIERMIQKSQKILHSTRQMQPREVRSDSIELRFRSNSKSQSKSKSKSKNLIESRLGKLNVTNATTHDATINSDAQYSLQKVKKPQKTKPQLFIDIEAAEGHRENILIHDSISPVSAIEHNDENFIDSSSFADSMESNFNLARRFQTENMNDSWENRFFSASMERKEEQKPHKEQKRVVLKRRRENHMRNITELEQHRSKPKRIFDSRVQPSKFSNYKQLAGKNDVKKILVEAPRKEEFRVSTLSSARSPCLKFQRENNHMGIEEFLKKVRQYGFVERYLSRAQICCIYEYLKSSSIPEYKWPLYVVDQVYQKMQTPKHGH